MKKKMMCMLLAAVLGCSSGAALRAEGKREDTCATEIGGEERNLELENVREYGASGEKSLPDLEPQGEKSLPDLEPQEEISPPDLELQEESGVPPFETEEERPLPDSENNQEETDSEQETSPDNREDADKEAGSEEGDGGEENEDADQWLHPLPGEEEFPEEKGTDEEEDFPFVILDGTDADRITAATEEDQQLVEDIENGRIFAIAPVFSEESVQDPENLLFTVNSEIAPATLQPGQYRIFNGEKVYCDEVWTQYAVNQGWCMATNYRYVEYLDGSGTVRQSPLYCMNAQKGGLYPGREGETLKEAAYRFMTNSNLKKMLYFGYGGPGDICGKYDPTCEHVNWSKWHNRFFYTHMALSIEYSKDYNQASAEQVRHIGLSAFMEKMKSLTIPSHTAVKLRGGDVSGNVVSTGSLRTPMMLYMSKPKKGFSWLESRFDQGFQRTEVLTVVDEGNAGNGIRVTRPPKSDYQLIYWVSKEEYASAGMNTPHVLGESESVVMKTGYRFCLIFPKTYTKTTQISWTMVLYPVQYLFIDGNLQAGASGNWIQDFGAYVYAGEQAKVSLTILPAPFGRIRVVKTSSRTNKPVAGAVYALFAAEDLVSGNVVRVRNGTKVGEGTSGTYGRVIFKDLIPGKYEIREKEAAPGYLLDTQSYSCRVLSDQVKEVAVKDTPDIKGKVSIEKLVEGTELHLSDAEFTVYEWSRETKNYRRRVEKLTYYPASRRYRSGILRYTDDNRGKFRVRETKNPTGYTGSWREDFVLGEPGTETVFTFQVENTPITIKKVEIRKVDGDTHALLSGAEFTLYEYDRFLGNYEAEGTLLTYDEEGEVYFTGELAVTDKNEGRFLVRETKNPPGYEGAWERELNLSDEALQLQYTVENTSVKIPTGQAEIIKRDSLTGEDLEGAEFTVYQWNVSSQTYEDTLGEKAQVHYISGEKKYRTAKLDITEENQGRFKLVETENPPGYVGTWEQEIQLSEELSLLSMIVENDPERLPVGSIRIVKKILEREILWAHGNPVFTFVVEGTDQQGHYRKYENYVRFSTGNLERDETGYVTEEVVIRNVPLGTYEVYEKPVQRYFLEDVQANTANVSIFHGSAPGFGRLPRETAWGSAVLTVKNREAALTFFNKAGRCDGYSHNDVLKNTIPWGTNTEP